jgi:hypothetical protein
MGHGFTWIVTDFFHQNSIKILNPVYGPVR